MPAFTTRVRLWNDHSFLRIALFFHPRPVRPGQIDFGQNWRKVYATASGGLHGAYRGPFLARAESAGRLLSGSLSTRGRSQSIGPSSSRPTHFTRVNRGKIYRRPAFPSFAPRICVHVGESLSSPFVRLPFPLSLRKSSRALYLANHGATFTGPTLIGSVRDALHRVMDFCRISRDWNIRVTSGMWNYARRTGCEPIETDVSRGVIISQHANPVCVIWNVNVQFESDF